MTLHIALDATLDDAPTTGIGLYGRELGSALESMGHRVERMGAERSGDVPRGAMSRTVWTLAVLPRLLASRPLFHAIGNFNLPLRPPAGSRCVLTVHDLIPLTHPETVSRAFRWQFRLWLSRALEVAAHVICPSAHTEQELLAHFPQVMGRTTVVHHGVDHVLREEDAAEARALVDAMDLPQRPVVYAGSLDVRKNVALVLDALERLGPAVPLVLVGQRWFGSGPVEERITSLQRQGFDVRALGHQPTGVYREVLRRAGAFAFPSLAEGFGLPPLEAMALGVPVVISDAGALPEVCGDAALQVSAHDAQALADALSTLRGESEAARARRVQRGLEWSARFTWKAAAERTTQVYIGAG
ncbi:MAG TPA: glycosyltransferase family 1 protein [Myxococcaceae bacterium]|nr:glycosyltransferase family 1 protein [Myxococcaceae bacterium]